MFLLFGLTESIWGFLPWRVFMLLFLKSYRTLLFCFPLSYFMSIYLLVPGLSCSRQTHRLWHVGSNSLTRDSGLLPCECGFLATGTPRRSLMPLCGLQVVKERNGDLGKKKDLIRIRQASSWAPCWLPRRIPRVSQTVLNNLYSRSWSESADYTAVSQWSYDTGWCKKQVADGAADWGRMPIEDMAFRRGFERWLPW